MACRCGHEMDEHSTEMDVGEGEVENRACNLCSCLAFQEPETSEKEFGLGDALAGLGPIVALLLFWLISQPSLQTFIVTGLVIALCWIVFKCRSDTSTFTASEEQKLRNEFRNMRKPRRLI